MFDYTQDPIGRQMTPDVPHAAAYMPPVGELQSFRPLFWAEHCLECSAPQCYSTCSYYVADRYRHCRRTWYGARTICGDYFVPATQIKYKKWGKLRCGFNLARSYTVEEFQKTYAAYMKKRQIAKRLDTVPNVFLPAAVKDGISRFCHHRWLLAHQGESNAAKAVNGLYLWIVLYSCEKEAFTLFLDAYDDSEQPALHTAHTICSGMNVLAIPLSDVLQKVKNLKALEMFPANNTEAELVFYFSDLVTFAPGSRYFAKYAKGPKPAEKVKCVVWDLDNTLWSGTVGEDGIENLSLREDAKALVEDLDRRGILQSIASKNDWGPAWQALKRFGIQDYFLYPQINWGPKSTSIKQISSDLNIGLDTLALIDDSPMERAEVESLLSNVRVYPETAIKTLLERTEFDVPVTKDAGMRRSFYMSEASRKKALEAHADTSYEMFIRGCHYQVIISPCREQADQERCYELLQRTNQLNASAKRVTREELRSLVKDKETNVWKVDCRDDYGTYGTIGCLIAQTRPNEIFVCDFVMSCRVAKRKIESCVLYALMKDADKPLAVRYIPTERNHVLLDEFQAIGGTYLLKEQEVRFRTDTLRDHDWATVTIKH